MFYVYSGYVSPDNFKSDDLRYTIKEFVNSEEVINFKKQFDKCVDSRCLKVIFRVFEGAEMILTPVKKIVDWTLKWKGAV